MRIEGVRVDMLVPGFVAAAVAGSLRARFVIRDNARVADVDVAALVSLADVGLTFDHRQQRGARVTIN